MIEIEVVTLKTPKSPAAEAYRTLRTNIQFLALHNKIQTIVITSSKSMEGKTTIASNLAVVMAQMGSKVLMVDCDQRKSKIHKVFGVSNEKGLSDILINEVNFKDVLKKLFLENLYILTAGNIPPNPSELFTSSQMKNLMDELKCYFDYIILDTPPINKVTDTQLISQYSDGCILVVSSGETKIDEIVKSKKLLENINNRILGVVLNKVEISKKDYYMYY